MNDKYLKVLGTAGKGYREEITKIYERGELLGLLPQVSEKGISIEELEKSITMNIRTGYEDYYELISTYVDELVKKYKYLREEKPKGKVIDIGTIHLINNLDNNEKKELNGLINFLRAVINSYKYNGFSDGLSNFYINETDKLTVGKVKSLLNGLQDNGIDINNPLIRYSYKIEDFELTVTVQGKKFKFNCAIDEEVSTDLGILSVVDESGYNIHKPKVPYKKPSNEKYYIEYYNRFNMVDDTIDKSLSFYKECITNFWKGYENIYENELKNYIALFEEGIKGSDYSNIVLEYQEWDKLSNIDYDSIRYMVIHLFNADDIEGSYKCYALEAGTSTDIGMNGLKEIELEYFSGGLVGYNVYGSAIKEHEIIKFNNETFKVAMDDYISEDYISSYEEIKYESRNALISDKVIEEICNKYKIDTSKYKMEGDDMGLNKVKVTDMEFNIVNKPYLGVFVDTVIAEGHNKIDLKKIQDRINDNWENFIDENGNQKEVEELRVNVIGKLTRGGTKFVYDTGAEWVYDETTRNYNKKQRIIILDVENSKQVEYILVFNNNLDVKGTGYAKGLFKLTTKRASLNISSRLQEELIKVSKKIFDKLVVLKIKEVPNITQTDYLSWVIGFIDGLIITDNHITSVIHKYQLKDNVAYNTDYASEDIYGDEDEEFQNEVDREISKMNQTTEDYGDVYGDEDEEFQNEVDRELKKLLSDEQGIKGLGIKYYGKYLGN